MEYIEYNENDIQTLKLTKTITSDNQVAGSCELGTAEIQMINDSNEYSSLKNKWIKTSLGSLYIYDVQPVQEKINIILSCYDVKQLLEVLYDKSKYENMFPCTIETWVSQIAIDLNITIKNVSDAPNSQYLLNEHPYIEDNSSYRTVLKTIAQACCSAIDTDINDNFYFRWFSETEHVIQDWINLTTEKEFTTPINAVSLGRGNVNDIVSYPENIANPKVFRIDNNYILDPQIADSDVDRRNEVIQPIYNRVNGLSYLIFDITTQDLQNSLNYNLGEKVKYVDIWDNEISTYGMTITYEWLGNDLTDSANYQITISATELKESSEEINYNSNVAEDIKQIGFIVDKQNGVIQGVVEKTEQIEQDITTTKQANGYPITIEDAGAYPLESIEIEGKSEQDGTPTSTAPIEIESVEGITNILDTRNLIEKTINGVTFTPIYEKGNLQYINVNGTASARAFYSINKGTLPTGTYRTTGCPSGGANNTYAIFNYSNSKNDTGNGEVCSANYNLAIFIESGYTANNLKFKPMISSDTTLTYNDYVPYGRWLEQRTTGKNLFNKNKITKVRYFTSNGSLGQSVDWAISDYIDVIGGTNYTYQGLTDVGASPYSCYYDKDKKFISSFKQTIGVNTITIPSNAYYVRFSVKTSVSDENTFQFEEGTATPYEPYKENTALIDLNKPNVFEKYLDTIEIGNSWNNSANTKRATIVIPYECNKPYTIKCSKMEGYQYVSIIETADRSTYYYTTNDTQPFSRTVVSNANTKYICLQLMTTNDFTIDMLDNLELKIYEGVETDDYYRFASIGDTKDTFENGLLTQRIGKYTITGNEDWTKYNNCWYCNTDIPYKKQEGITTMCTHYQSANNGRGGGDAYNNGNNTICLYYPTDLNRIYFRDDSITTGEQLIEFLTNNTIELYYILATPIEHNLDYEILELHEGYNNITLNDELEPNMSVVYLTDSKMNAQYATKAEWKITNEEIRSEVSKKVGNDEVISKINQSAEEVQINAEKISLEGKEINMTSEDILITSDNLTIDKDGSIKMVGGTEENPTYIIQNEDGTRSTRIGHDFIIVDNDNTGSKYVLNVSESGQVSENIRTENYSKNINIVDGGIYNEGMTKDNIQSMWMQTIDVKTVVKPGEITIDNPNYEYAANKIIPVQYSSYNSGNVDAATDVNQVLGSGLTLPAGRYIVVTQFSFSANATGLRRVNISTTSGSAEANIQHGASPSGVTRMRHTQLLNNTKDTTIYWNVSQNSGATLSCNATAWIYRIQ